MSKVPPGVERQTLYVAARRVLLDALDALAGQREALILVGAQAVYIPETRTSRLPSTRRMLISASIAIT